MSILNAPWVDEELRILHDSALRFTQAEFEPHREAWEQQGMCDRQAGRPPRLPVAIPCTARLWRTTD